MAQEIVRRKPDIIFAPTNGAALAARSTTQSIPVIFATVPDPVGQGFVASLSRPGGNMTGTTNVQTGLTPKRIQLLGEIIPRLSRVAIIYDPLDKVATDQASEARTAAAELKLQLRIYEANNLDAFRQTFDTLKKEHVQAVLVAGSLASYDLSKAIAELGIKYRLPTMNTDRKYVEDGALISYGVSLPALLAKAATYVDRVLKGAKPADLPVEQPDKFEMVLNLRTAKALGITIPHSVTVRADQIIR
jgi:putative ABC transport system substrate-binding protein